MTARKTKAAERAALITNLSFVGVGAVRIHCHALLFHEDPDPVAFTGPRLSVRGFGSEPSWETFDLTPESIDFDIDMRVRSIADISVTDYYLFCRGIPELRLWRDDADQKMSIDRFQGQNVLPDQVWPILTDRVARFWRAPFMLGVATAPPREMAARNRARWLP